MSRAKKQKPKFAKHLWMIEVRHRDFETTANDASKRIWMKNTRILIIVTQSHLDTPSIDRAITKARRFVGRRQREYAIPSIRDVEYRGTVDE